MLIEINTDNDVFEVLLTKLLKDGLILPNNGNLSGSVNVIENRNIEFDTAKAIRTINILFFEFQNDIELLKSMKLEDVHKSILEGGGTIELVKNYDNIFKEYIKNKITKEVFIIEKKRLFSNSLNT